MTATPSRWEANGHRLMAMAIKAENAPSWDDALQKLWPTVTCDDAVAVIVESARQLTNSGRIPLGSTQTVRSAFAEADLPS